MKWKNKNKSNLSSVVKCFHGSLYTACAAGKYQLLLFINNFNFIALIILWCILSCIDNCTRII